MTLRELYTEIGGDYDRAIKVLRIEKLVDKHIRKLPANPVFGDLAEAGKAMDGERIFECAHAIKGVCANLGLVDLADAAEELCEEFRSGNPRKMTDAEVGVKLAETQRLFDKAAKGIRSYASEV